MSKKLSPDASKIVLVKQLPYKITSDDMYDLFGRYGKIRQIRMGNTDATRGRAFVIYTDPNDAQQAVEHLNGYNVGGRYLTLSFYRPKPPTPAAESAAAAATSSELSVLQHRFGM